MNNESVSDNVRPEITSLEDIPPQELLGSVTTYTHTDGPEYKNQQLRSSARVFKKIKLDANLSIEKEKAPLLPDKKEEPKPEQNKKCLRPIWTADDKNLFFEALNEYGKDFENIHAYIGAKLKKKGVLEPLIKTKDQIRHFYYRTWLKMSKYLKFSDGVNKVARELYCLINYGEIRKKTMLTTQKICIKLQELIYNGYIAIRTRGKTIRVKTPMCRALRRLNQLDDKYDELKLPSRVTVELRPKDMLSFLKVQNLALNPRIRTILPIQKRLSCFINCVSKRWRAAEVDFIKKIDDQTDPLVEEKIILNERLVTPNLKFSPPAELKIETPAINLSEYFTRQSICLKSYEERMGIVSAAYVLSLLNDKKDGKKAGSKARTDSSTENQDISPIKSEPTPEETNTLTNPETSPANNLIKKFDLNEKLTEIETSNDENLVSKDLDDAVLNIISLTQMNFFVNNDPLEDPLLLKEEPFPNLPSTSHVSEAPSDFKFSYIKSEEKGSEEDTLSKINQIKNGWTIEDCDTLTIGELYLMFGSDAKLTIEYSWPDQVDETQISLSDIAGCMSDTEIVTESFKDITQTFSLNHSLRKLLSVAKLYYRRNIIRCPCGHVCSPKNASNKKTSDVRHKANVEHEDKNQESGEPDQNNLNGDEKSTNNHCDDFIPPSNPPVHLMAQLDSIQKLKPKYSVRKGRRLRANQVVVERELPLLSNSAHQIVKMNIISKSNNTSAANLNNSVSKPAEIEVEEPDVKNVPLKLMNNLTSQCEKDIVVPMDVESNNTVNKEQCLSVLLQDATRSISPSRILKENESQWISSEVGDFSLSSFLGHLDSPMKPNQEDIPQDVVQSLLNETSLDYTAKFADLAQTVTSDKTK